MPEPILPTSRVLAVALGVCLASACGATARPNQEQASDRTADRGALARYYNQKPTWRACPADELPKPPAEPSPSPSRQAAPRFECTTIKVPLDYRKPAGQTITLALNRLPALDQGRRVGSLVTNPGGPGESGLGLVYHGEEVFTPTLHARYDIIGMDPRGAGKSAPVRCQTPQEMAQTAQQHPEDEVAQAKAFVAACKAKSGRLLAHVGTDNVARDLDVVRAVLGEPKLHYLGFSYGTALGLFYAQQFPGKVGRMVLDSVADPADWPGDPAAQPVGFETTLGVFVATCTARPHCPMGNDRAQALEQIDKLTERVETRPLPTGAHTPPLNDDLLLGLLSQAMYDEQVWPPMADALGAALAGDGGPLGQLAAQAAGGSAQAADDATGSFEAVACLHQRPEERTLAAARQGAQEAATAAPVFGPQMAEMLLRCAVWPAPSLPQAGRAVTDRNIPPILLAANLYDPATPVQWARDVHGQLARSVLVTNTSGGHIFYRKGPCTHRVVDSYLTTGRLPAKGTVCHDRAPGLTPPSPTPTPRSP